MKCPNCGNENPPDYLFCDECGARLIGNDVAAATGDESGNMQPQDTGGGGGDSGVTPYISDNAQSDVDAPISTYGDYNVGVGMGTGDTVAEGIANAEEQSGSAAADAAQADNSATAEAAVPVTEDTVSTGQDADRDADDAAMPVQPMAQAADSDYGAAAGDTTSGYDSGASNATSAYQDAAASVTGIADDARQAVDEDVADLGNMDWMSSAPSVASNYADQAVPAPSGGQGTAAAPAGNDWAAHALSLLDQAQSSLSSGDWGAFGHSMNDLRAALQNVAGGAAGMFAQAQTAGAAGNAAAENADQTWNGAAVPDYSAAVSDYSEPATSGQSADYGTPAPSPMGGMPQGSSQGMGAMPEPSYMGAPSQQADSTASAGMGDSGVATQEPTLAPAVQPIPVSSTSSGPMTSTAPAGTGARLILISSGAEMALPDQEEITVGREDPSSGIFPDVDLTPHGGEDGGVSRRHARLLHVGDDYFVEDLQSTNFTKLDGQRLPAHVRERLDDGARIDFGRVAMIFRRG